MNFFYFLKINKIYNCKIYKRKTFNFWIVFRWLFSN